MKTKGPVIASASLPPLCSPLDVERVLEFEFARATENAALTAIQFIHFDCRLEGSCFASRGGCFRHDCWT